MKRHSRLAYFLIATVLAGGSFFVWFSPAFADPPTSPYLPGATLNPSCAPTDPNCTVFVPPTGTGTAGSLAYWLATSTVSSTPLLFWDNTSVRLGIGTSSPLSTLSVVGGATISGNATTSNLSILNLASAGNPCLTVGTTGVVATSSCITSATGTVNQVVVSSTGSSLTFSLPQNIDTGASVTFANVSTTAERSASSTIINLTFTNATSTGGLTIGTILANTQVSSTALMTPSGTITTLAASTSTFATLFANALVSSTQLISPSGTITNLTFGNATSAGSLQVGTLWAITLVSTTAERSLSSTITNLTFTNATSTGSLQVGTLWAATLVSSTAIMSPSGTITALAASTSTFATLFANALVSSTQIISPSSTFSTSTFATLFANASISSTQLISPSGTITNLTFGNATSAGSLQVGTLWAITLVSTTAERSLSSTITNLTFTNATSTGSLQVGTLWAATLVSSTAIMSPSGTITALAASTSTFATLFANALVSSTQLISPSGTIGTFTATGLTTLASSAVLSASPIAIGTKSLLQLGATAISGGAASGTFLGINPSTFAGNFISLQVNGATKFTVNATGTLIIGSSTAVTIGTGAALVVCGQTSCTLPTATSSVIQVASVDGTTSSASIVARGQVISGSSDIGEYVSVVGDESQYEQGDVLSVSANNPGKFEKSAVAYDPDLAGVVTVSAGLIAGGGEDNHGSLVIALQGRLPVKVSGVNGPIAVGDYLTSSDIPGVAQKATDLGRVVGIAMESFNGASSTDRGRILAFMEKSYYPGIAVGSLSSAPVGQALQGGSTGAGAALNIYTFDPNTIYSFNNLHVQHLEVGSSTAPSGITTYDIETNEAYCILVENGVLKAVPGKCGEGATTNRISNSMSSQDTGSAPPIIVVTPPSTPPPVPSDNAPQSSSTSDTAVASDTTANDTAASDTTANDTAASDTTVIVITQTSTPSSSDSTLQSSSTSDATTSDTTASVDTSTPDSSTSSPSENQ